MRGIMARIRNLPENLLKGTCETDEAYVKAGSKGVALDTNGGDRTVPSRRGLPHGPGRSAFEKNRPMVTMHFQRATEDEPDHTIMDVPRDGKTLADMVQGRIEPGSTVMTDEHTAYKNLKERGCDHHTICHGKGEYASCERNEIHTSTCECRIGLSKWWLKKRRGISKRCLAFYTKPFQLVHNTFHYGLNGRFVVTLAVVLDRFDGMQA